MKKLNLLIVVAMMAALLLAANPAGKLVRLEVINKTDFPVYIKLEGRHTDAFYYLTIPDDDEMTFTVLSDDYKRTTWACDGIKSSGDLVMTGNVRLVFTPCGQMPLRWVLRWYRWWDDDPMSPTFGQLLEWTTAYRMPNFGEPTMEKVWYWKEYSFVRWRKLVDPVLAAAAICDPTPIDLCDVYWSPNGWISWFSVADPTDFDGHFTLWIPLKLGVASRTYKGPVGVWWRYQY